MSNPLITLTTDFGNRDPYVAAMKGVIASRCPEARIEDLSHEIGAQNLFEAALFVSQSAPYYPAETIHVIVVDPGVGTKRQPVAVRAHEQTFIAPDNGLLTLFLRQYPLEEARIIENPALMRETISATFHGRDIFAPTAAGLAAGTPLSEVGPVAESLERLSIPDAQRENNHLLHGMILHVDRFGNCITNIQPENIEGMRDLKVQLNAVTLDGIKYTYADADAGEPLALFGSSGQLEIALREGNASEKLGAAMGTPVTVYEST